MANARQIPNAMRVFGWALLAGVAGAAGAFRVAMVLFARLIPRDPMMAGAFALLTAGAVGVAAAVTAGVLVGRTSSA